MYIEDRHACVHGHIIIITKLNWVHGYDVCVCECVCVCVCVCVRACVCVHACMHVYASMHVCVCTCVDDKHTYIIILYTCA